MWAGSRSRPGSDRGFVVDDGSLEVTARVRVPERELSWRFAPSGGPGGQHANTSNTRAELTFNVARSVAFSDAQRERVLRALGAVVTVVAMAAQELSASFLLKNAGNRRKKSSISQL